MTGPEPAEAGATAPGPADPGPTDAGPSDPPVRRHRGRKLVTRTLVRAWDDNIFSEAAAAAFWQTLSLPPLLLGLFGILSYVGDLYGPDTVTAVEEQVVDLAGRVFSREAVEDIIAPTVSDILTNARAEVVSIGFVISLWSGSSAMSSFVDAITRAHEQYLLRNPVWQRLLALLLYVVGLVTGIVALPIVAIGPERPARFLPESWQPTARPLLDFLLSPLVIGLVLLLALTTLYKIALPLKPPWYRGLPGALLAAAVFLARRDRAAGVPGLADRHRLHLRRAGRADRVPAGHVLHRDGDRARRALQRVDPVPVAGSAAGSAQPPRPGDGEGERGAGRRRGPSRGRDRRGDGLGGARRAARHPDRARTSPCSSGRCGSGPTSPRRYWTRCATGSSTPPRRTTTRCAPATVRPSPATGRNRMTHRTESRVTGVPPTTAVRTGWVVIAADGRRRGDARRGDAIVGTRARPGRTS